jgi:hypothetical protein
VAAEAAACEVEALASATQVEAEEEDKDDDYFDWSDDDGPNPEEAAAQQRAIVESFESQKKLQDNARAREDEQIRRTVKLSLRRRSRGG